MHLARGSRLWVPHGGRQREATEPQSPTGGGPAVLEQIQSACPLIVWPMYT